MDTSLEDVILREEIGNILACRCSRCETQAAAIATIIGALLSAHRDAVCSSREKREFVQTMTKANGPINKRHETATRAKLEELEMAALAARFKLFAMRIYLDVILANVYSAKAKLSIKQIASSVARDRWRLGPAKKKDERKTANASDICALDGEKRQRESTKKRDRDGRGSSSLVSCFRPS
jgi:hypothetical protein